MKNRDAKRRFKRKERQIQTAGKFPFHRVQKLQKALRKSIPRSRG